MSKEITPAELKNLISKGKKKGALTYKEIMDALQTIELSPEQIDEIYEAFAQCGVEIINDPIKDVLKEDPTIDVSDVELEEPVINDEDV